MILFDTSVWVSHFQSRREAIVSAIADREAIVHDFVIGELVCGGLTPRHEAFSLLLSLPGAPMVEHSEVVELVTSERLWQFGIGWVDSHLLASAMIAKTRLLSLDAGLSRAARVLGIGA